MTQSYNLSQLANKLNTSGQVDATTGLVNAVPAANGGTGQASYTVGDVLYASGTTALSKLADVATGNALISGGVGVAPSYGKIGLTTHVSGTLPVANGGTGNTSGTAVNVSGTVAIANGGTGQTTAAAGSALGAIGVGQTWQNVTSTRAFGTTYTNSTGRPIFIAVSSDAYTFATLYAIIDSVTIQKSSTSWQAGSNSAQASISLIVPAGSTYSITQGVVGSSGGVAATWFELR